MNFGTSQRARMGQTGLREDGGALEVPPTSLNLGDPTRGARARLGDIYDGARERDASLQDRGIIRTEDGCYLQAATRPDGTPGFVVVDPAELERGLRQDVGAEISKAAVGDLSVYMRAQHQND